MTICTCGCEKECKKTYLHGHHWRGKPSPNRGNKQIAWNKGIPQTPEQRKKNSDSKKGRQAWNKGLQIKEQSSFWLGGSKVDYAPGFTEEVREFVRERNNRECQCCGRKEKDLTRKIETHHIDFEGENHAPENLISLCRSCHLRKHKQHATATAV